MPVQLTIRDVPDEVRDELAARAAAAGMSTQAWLRRELIRIASRPDLGQWLARVRERKELAGTRVDPEDILAERDADRR